jgi:hypothetical protein
MSSSLERDLRVSLYVTNHCEGLKMGLHFEGGGFVKI